MIYLIVRDEFGRGEKSIIADEMNKIADSFLKIL